MKKAFFGALVAMATLSGCGMENDFPNPNLEKCVPIDYNQGVYYFPCIETDFTVALSSFKEQNPTLAVTAMTGNGTDAYGMDRGYIVNFETKAE